MGKAALRRDMVRAAGHQAPPAVHLPEPGRRQRRAHLRRPLARARRRRQRSSRRTRDFAEDFLIVDLPGERVATLADVSTSREEEAWKALTLGLGDYTRKCGFTSVVLGLSGGIDSALTAALAADALGPSQVTGVAMPTRYSSQHSLDDAEALARNLGIGYRVVPIDGVFQSYLDALRPGAARIARRRGREHPGAHPRRHAHGVLEHRGRDAALDGQQVGARGRLLHALRRHVRRPCRDQRRAEDARLRSGALREPGARDHPATRASPRRRAPSCGRTRPTRTPSRPTT